MRSCWFLVCLCAYLFRGHHVSHQRAGLASQTEAFADGRQGKTIGIFEGSLDTESRSYKGLRGPETTPLQVNAAGQGNNKTGATGKPGEFHPLHISHVSGLVWHVRSQQDQKGNLLSPVWHPVGGICAAAKFIPVVRRWMEQSRIATEKAVPKAEKCGESHTEPESWQLASGVSSRQRPRGQVPPGQCQRKRCKILGGAAWGLAAAFYSSSGAAFAATTPSGADKASAVLRDCGFFSGSDRSGELGIGFGNEEGRASPFRAGNTCDAPARCGAGPGEAAAPFSLGTAEGQSRAGQDTIREATVSEWLVQLSRTTFRPTPKAVGGTDCDSARLGGERAPVDELASGGQQGLTDPDHPRHRGQHGQYGNCRGISRRGGGSRRGHHYLGEGLAGPARTAGAGYLGSPGRRADGQGESWHGSGSCRSQGTRSHATATQGRRGCHRRRGGPWRRLRLGDEQVLSSLGHGRAHTIESERDYVCPSLALLLGLDLQRQVLNDDCSQHFDPRIQADDLSASVQPADGIARDDCFPAGIVAYDPPKSRGGIDGWDSVSLAGGCGGSSDNDEQVFQGSSRVQNFCLPFSPHLNPCAGRLVCCPPSLSILSTATEASRAMILAAGRCVRFSDAACPVVSADASRDFRRLLLQAARAFRGRPRNAAGAIFSSAQQNEMHGPFAEESFPLCAGGELPGPTADESFPPSTVTRAFSLPNSGRSALSAQVAKPTLPSCLGASRSCPHHQALQTSPADASFPLDRIACKLPSVASSAAGIVLDFFRSACAAVSVVDESCPPRTASSSHEGSVVVPSSPRAVSGHPAAATSLPFPGGLLSLHAVHEVLRARADESFPPSPARGIALDFPHSACAAVSVVDESCPPRAAPS